MSVTDRLCYACRVLLVEEVVVPAPKKGSSPSGQSWGITYRMVEEAMEDYETHHNCRIEFSVTRYTPFKSAPFKVWAVVASAVDICKAGTPIRGQAECTVGGNRGAASIAGAMLRALVDACDDLEARRAKPSKAPELARLPGFD